MLITKTFEPIRSLHAPDDGSAYAKKDILGGGWTVDYGWSYWPSRNYLMVPILESEMTTAHDFYC